MIMSKSILVFTFCSSCCGFASVVFCYIFFSSYWSIWITRISNTYFRKLLKWYDRKVELGEVAFIPTDVAMVVDAGLRKYVQKFAKSESAFESAFASAYQKLVDSNTITQNRY